VALLVDVKSWLVDIIHGLPFGVSGRYEEHSLSALELANGFLLNCEAIV